MDHNLRTSEPQTKFPGAYKKRYCFTLYPSRSQMCPVFWGRLFRGRRFGGVFFEVADLGMSVKILDLWARIDGVVFHARCFRFEVFVFIFEVAICRTMDFC